MTKFWLVRAFPGDVDHTEYFKKNNVVGLGWIDLGDLSSSNLDNLKDLFVSKKYPASSPQAMGRRVGFFRRFIEEIKVDDYILVPDRNGVINIGVITSNYYYQKVTNQLGHLRNVKWIKETDLEDYPKSVQILLANRLTLISLEKVSDELSNIVKDNNIIKINRSLEKKFVANINDNEVRLTVPENLTRPELKIFFDKVLQQY